MTGVTAIKQYVIVLLFAITTFLALTTVWWVTIAILATAIIALLIIIDGFFFVDKIYKSPAEPTAISGLMQGIPLLLIPFVHPDFSATIPIAVAFLTGMAYAYAFNLYFKSLNDDPDAVVISIMWNLMFVMVPVLAYFGVHEDLAHTQYIGIILIIAGATIASFQKARSQKMVIVRMFFAVILLSLAEVALKWVFIELQTAGNPSVFWSGALAHSAGSLFIGVLFFAKIAYVKTTRNDFFKLVVKFWWIFVIIELLQVLADFLANYSISAGDVSVVVGMGGLMGIFAIGIVTLVVYMFSNTRLHNSLLAIQQSQFEHFTAKLLGMFIITCGAYFMILM